MTKEELDQIKRYIILKVIYELEVLYRDAEFYFTEIENRVAPCLSFQMYYDKRINRLYIYYDIDDITRFNKDPLELCKRINKIILTDLRRKYFTVAEIIGPGNFYNDIDMSNKIDISTETIRLSTVSYWKLFNDKYYFIENGAETDLDRMNYYMSNSDDEKQEEFEKSIIEINKKYDFENNNDKIPEGFNEYNTLFKELYGRELKPVEDSEIITVFLSIRLKDNIEF